MLLKFIDDSNLGLPGIFLTETGYLRPLIQISENDLYNIKMWRLGHDDHVALTNPYYEPYCYEIDIINKIKLNEEGYFDFSKSIIDIGAHVGVYSFTLDFNYNYSFEPNKFIYHILNVNMMIHNKFNNASIYNVLLSDKSNEYVRYDGFSTILTDQPTKNFNDMPQGSDRYDEVIKSHILDEYNCANVGFIKIDVEGMEEKVLRGGIGTIIRNNYPPILFELWSVGKNGMTQEKYDSLKTFLENLGYKILWNWGDCDTHLAIH